jgi:hypothetical protein
MSDQAGAERDEDCSGSDEAAAERPCSLFNLLHAEASRLGDGRLSEGGVDLRGHVGRLLEGAGPVRGLGRGNVEVHRLGGSRDILLEHGGAEELQEEKRQIG